MPIVCRVPAHIWMLEWPLLGGPSPSTASTPIVTANIARHAAAVILRRRLRRSLVARDSFPSRWTVYGEARAFKDVVADLLAEGRVVLRGAEYVRVERE